MVGVVHNFSTSKFSLDNKTVTTFIPFGSYFFNFKSLLFLSVRNFQAHMWERTPNYIVRTEMQEEILHCGPPAALLCHAPHTVVGFPFSGSHAALLFLCFPAADNSVINMVTCIAL